MDPKIRPILEELKAGLEALYGDRLDQVILYGSQARGDARPDSDIDVLVVLRGPIDRSREMKRIFGVTIPLELNSGIIISPLLRTEGDIDPTRRFYRNIASDGIRI